MQSSINLHGVSFKQNPRDGQRRVFDKASDLKLKQLSIKLPTGYGKTFTAAGVYAIRQKHCGINRLLYITPTTAQHEAFCNDGHCDLDLAGVTGPNQVTDYLWIADALRRHRANTHQVFAVTIQGLCSNAGDISKLLETGRWMIVVDEYHHYGANKAWGFKAGSLSNEFLLSMSATPYRPQEDGAFPAPSIEVDYRDAMEEGAVKKLIGHSYTYKIDAINEDGEIESLTTSDLVKLAGGSDPDKIEKLKIKRRMRWSPKYVSPLVSIPIERMLSDRISSGYKLQAIIGAMCVSHAELVCEQIKTMFPELSIDWVGTGDNGRPKDKNQELIQKFCPRKENGERPQPSLDVLVHVGIAGEGLDTTRVSEIVHLNAAGLNNSNNQENGRASRRLGDVIGHINFDNTSEYSLYVGEQIMQAMDFLPPKPEESDRDPSDEPSPLPEEPSIRIWDMELLSIDSGSPEVARFAKVVKESGHTSRTLKEMRDDPNPAELNHLMELYRWARRQECQEHNEKAIIEQWNDSVTLSLSVVTGRVIKAMQKNGHRVDKSLAGDIKKRINTEKKKDIGEVKRNIDVLRKHYKWLQSLEVTIIDRGVPSWLE